LSNNLHSEKEFVRNHYDQMILAHQKEETILVSHFGELSQNVISNLEGNVEEKITSLEISKGPIKKIFFISVETLQNMLIHGQKTNEGEQHNFFILAKNTVNIQIISANLVSNTSIPSLEKQVNVINSFEDEKSLKAYYLEHLENNTLSEKGGAGLGFITIAMKSGNKLSVDFQKINDQFSLFTLTSVVNLA